jgi:hypothetical protein
MNKPRVSLTSHLITKGLGYCCPAFFWERFWEVPTDIVAARLGVSERTVSRHRKLANESGFKCEQTEKCKLNQRKPK